MNGSRIKESVFLPPWPQSGLEQASNNPTYNTPKFNDFLNPTRFPLDDFDVGCELRLGDVFLILDGVAAQVPVFLQCE